MLFFLDKNENSILMFFFLNINIYTTERIGGDQQNQNKETINWAIVSGTVCGIILVFLVVALAMLFLKKWVINSKITVTYIEAMFVFILILFKF